MKIIRHLTPAGPAYAELMPDGTAEALTGALFADLQRTGKRVERGRVLAPLIPSNILGIGLNYRKHAEETGKPVPQRPMWFMKTGNALQDPESPILLPTTAASEKVDYEGELGVVIGRACKNVRPENALSYVGGYTVANDISARDWQFEWGGGQFCQGKSFDSFCPIGPVLVTPDEIENPNTLTLTTRLNGAVVQQSSTADMVFDVAALISFLSSSRTLAPGTLLLTGTPQGVGFAQKPPRFLQVGDTVSIEIEKIGTLSNSVTRELPR